MKVLVKTLIILLVFLYTPRLIFAAGFNLQSINGVNVDGRLYSQLYHTSLQPTFTGEAPAETTVNININQVDYTTTTDESGVWSWTPPEPLNEGDNAVVLTNEEATISFTLTLGEAYVDWDEVGKEVDEEVLPTVGFFLPTVGLITGGTAISAYFIKRFTT